MVADTHKTREHFGQVWTISFVWTTIKMINIMWSFILCDRQQTMPQNRQITLRIVHVSLPILPCLIVYTVTAE